MSWEAIVLLPMAVVAGGALLAVVWRRQSGTSRGVAALREQAGDLVRLPGRLRRVAADPRTPRRARWLLVGLAIYVASPIDPIPDFIPIVGHLDELVIVPLVLRRVRRMIPDEVWADSFGGDENRDGQTV